MTAPPCDDFAQKLVDYSDGELPLAEIAEVEAHVAACQHCSAMLASLRRSLGHARGIWNDAEAGLAQVRVPGTHMPRTWLRRHVALAAATVLLALALPAVLYLLTLSNPSTGPGGGELSLAEIERTVSATGMSARMLAAADLLAKHDEGLPMARQQYEEIARKYRDDYAEEAKMRLRSLSEGRM